MHASDPAGKHSKGAPNMHRGDASPGARPPSMACTAAAGSPACCLAGRGAWLHACGRRHVHPGKHEIKHARVLCRRAKHCHEGRRPSLPLCRHAAAAHLISTQTSSPSLGLTPWPQSAACPAPGTPLALTQGRHPLWQAQVRLRVRKGEYPVPIAPAASPKCPAAAATEPFRPLADGFCGRHSSADPAPAQQE